MCVMLMMVVRALWIEETTGARNGFNSDRVGVNNLPKRTPIHHRFTFRHTC